MRKHLGMCLRANVDATAFAVQFFPGISEKAGSQPNKVSFMPGGLERIMDNGLALLWDGLTGDRADNRNEDYTTCVLGE